MFKVKSLKLAVLLIFKALSVILKNSRGLVCFQLTQKKVCHCVAVQDVKMLPVIMFWGCKVVKCSSSLSVSLHSENRGRDVV